MKFSFKNWILNEDIFGFEKSYKSSENQEDTDPIVAINIEEIINGLLTIKINDSYAFSNFVSEVQWGKHPGALKLEISPLGSFKAYIRRLQEDLSGNKVWLCKKVLPYKDIMHSDIVKERKMSDFFFEKLQEINENQLESAIPDYNNLENLVVKIARDSQLSKNMPLVLIFTGIKEIEYNKNYIIHYEARGHGVEVPSQNRLEMFSIDMSYNKNTGLIRSMGYEVQSPQKGHKWNIVPADWDEYFSPAQSMNEISSCVCGALRGY